MTMSAGAANSGRGAIHRDISVRRDQGVQTPPKRSGVFLSKRPTEIGGAVDILQQHLIRSFFGTGAGQDARGIGYIGGKCRLRSESNSMAQVVETGNLLVLRHHHRDEHLHRA
jgi:hypothetical protein